MSVVVFTLVPRSSAPRRKDLLSALGLDEDGAPAWELGRPETGATCLVVEDKDGGFKLHVPLLRSPTSARDLLPSLRAAAHAAGCDWRCAAVPPELDDEDPLAVWDLLHREACAGFAGPHLPRAELERLHAWLVLIAATPSAARPMLVLDPPTRVVVGLPETRPCLLPPFDVLANDGDGVTRVHAIARFGAPAADGFVHLDGPVDLDGGEVIGPDVRVLTPVEIVDDESLG